MGDSPARCGFSSHPRCAAAPSLQKGELHRIPLIVLLCTTLGVGDDAPAGAYHSEEECVQYARTSDGLVSLLAGALTRVTRAEYEAARRAGADRFVLCARAQS